jgi:hypothetical protein
MRVITMFSWLAVVLSACAADGLTGVSPPQPVVVAPSSPLSQQGRPLILLDGRQISDSAARAIRPSSLRCVEVLKRKAATARYGERGRFGVVLLGSSSAQTTSCT